MYTICGPVHVGYYIVAERKDDGRHFRGVIESVKALTKGTLVVVRRDYDDNEPSYKSFYLESLVSWDVHPNADYMIEKYDF